MTEPQNNRPPGLRAQAKAEAMRRIRQSAGQLFAERDYAEVTTKEIAQLAGIGEATLFRHISSKSELLIMIYGDQMRSLIRHLDMLDDEKALLPITAERVRERIQAFYFGRSQFFLLHPENAARYLRQSYDLTSSGRVQAMELGDYLIRKVTEILEEAQKARVIADVVDASLVALNCHGIFLHEINRTRARGFAPETIWERVSERFDAQLLPLMPEDADALRLLPTKPLSPLEPGVLEDHERTA